MLYSATTTEKTTRKVVLALVQELHDDEVNLPDIFEQNMLKNGIKIIKYNYYRNSFGFHYAV